MYYLKEAVANLIATKLRTLLAMVGVLVGTASVVAMVSCGQLATQAALAQFKTLGTDKLAISLYAQGNSNSGGTSTEFTLADAMDIVNVSPDILSVSPYITQYAPVTFNGQSLDASIIGVTENLQNLIAIKMLQGRFVSDLDKYANFCVLGYKTYQNLNTPAKNLIGSQIKVGENIFTIVGIIKQWPENSFFNQDINNSILIPLQTAQLMSKYATISNIIARLSATADITTVQNEITRYVQSKTPNEKLFFRSAKELIKSMEAQQQIFTLLLGLIGSISLLVGGIGVMNIMLVSVLERRREIGVRLALGARRRDIQYMFLNEAIALCVTGGILGIILGIITSFVIAVFAKWHFDIFFWPPLIGFTVSVLIGIFFGYYPARQASLLDPIAVLRLD